MLEYARLRPYIPPTKYNEREWLAFRAIFLKVYRAQQVTLAPGCRVPVVQITAGLTKAGASHMKITKGKATVFVPYLSEQEELELPKSWGKISKPHHEDDLALGVGPYAWWGIVDKKLALSSPQKMVRFFVEDLLPN